MRHLSPSLTHGYGRRREFIFFIFYLLWRSRGISRASFAKEPKDTKRRTKRHLPPLRIFFFHSPRPSRHTSRRPVCVCLHGRDRHSTSLRPLRLSLPGPLSARPSQLSHASLPLDSNGERLVPAGETQECAPRADARAAKARTQSY